MIFEPTKLEGGYVIRPERKTDERGFFARSYCSDEFGRFGLVTKWTQCNISYNHHRGLMRGLHYQIAPHEEVKLVRCTRGAVFDVMVDLRDESPSFLKWFGVELSEKNHTMLYVPEGFAHGYQTMTDESEVFYQVSTGYHPPSEKGLRWNDPAIGINWPLEVTIISDRDSRLPLLSPRTLLGTLKCDF